MKAVDLFAGGGGFTEGARRAGVDVLWAANHDPLAVAVHAARHPETEHSCQDLEQADFSAIPDHDLLLASPACQGHSHAGAGARGKWGLDFSHHDRSRSTAWAIVSAAEAKRPAWLLVENVPRFRQWPLYRHWTGALRELAYKLEEVELDAADFGAPQNRRRLFVIGRRCARPGIADALPTPAGPRERRSSWAPMRTILDLDGGVGWKPVASKSDRVRERVERSRARHGEVFLTQHVRDHYGRGLDQPLPTITTGDQMALVRGDEMRPLSLGEYLAGQGLPVDYLDGVQLTRKQASRIIGNAVAGPVAEALVGAVRRAA